MHTEIDNDGAKLRKVESKTKEFILFFCRDGEVSLNEVKKFATFGRKVTKKTCKEQRILEN